MRGLFETGVVLHNISLAEKCRLIRYIIRVKRDGADSFPVSQRGDVKRLLPIPQRRAPDVARERWKCLARHARISLAAYPPRGM